MTELINNIWAVYLDTAFWLLLGLLAAGLVKTLIPEDAMQRWLGGRGMAAVGRAALFGAPLPLCSCGVLPAAIGLRRSGASKEATVSFLISTPETSIDSVAVTYALMGPLMAIYRPFAALMTAIVTGMMVAWVDDEARPESNDEAESAGCCGDSRDNGESASCCSSQSSCCESTAAPSRSRIRQAIHYATTDLLDDIVLWLFLGIVIAGLINTLVPPGWLAQWGQGIGAMLVMLVVGIPMYICAVASTPIAAGLILAGVSPGTVMVFLLVGPATNIAGLILVKKELGLKVTAVYLLGIALVSITMGLLLDGVIEHYSLIVDVEIGADQQVLPELLSWGSAVLLLVLSLKPLRQRVLPI